jgi:glutamate racemase
MVPADVVLLDHLPVSAGGKIDRAALMATAPRAVAPDKDRTGVARLWAEALGGDPGPEGATFVQSGGTSLQALWLAARIERAYDAEISAVDLLGWTVSELSTKLRHASFASPPLRIEPVGEALSYDEARSLSDAELRRRFEQLYGLPGDD